MNVVGLQLFALGEAGGGSKSKQHIYICINFGLLVCLVVIVILSCYDFWVEYWIMGLKG